MIPTSAPLQRSSIAFVRGVLGRVIGDGGRRFSKLDQAYLHLEVSHPLEVAFLLRAWPDEGLPWRYVIGWHGLNKGGPDGKRLPI